MDISSKVIFVADSEDYKALEGLKADSEVVSYMWEKKVPMQVLVEEGGCDIEACVRAIVNILEVNINVTIFKSHTHQPLV